MTYLIPEDQKPVEKPKAEKPKTSISERLNKVGEKAKQTAAELKKAFEDLRQKSPIINLIPEQEELNELGAQLEDLNNGTEINSDGEISPNQDESEEPVVEKPAILDPETEYQKAVVQVQPEASKDPFTVFEKHAPRETPSPVIPEKTRIFTLQDKARHELLAGAARLKGVKDIQGFNHLVEYFESNFTQYTSQNIEYRENISQDERQKILASWEAKGYSAYFSSESRDGKIKLHISRDVPFNVSIDSIPAIKTIMATGVDPEPVLNALKLNMPFNTNFPFFLGSHNLDSNHYPSVTTKFIDLLQDPNLPVVVSFIEKMSLVPHETWKIYDFYSKESQTDTLSEFVKRVDVSAYTPEFFEKVGVIAKALGRNVDIEQLPDYLELVNNPDRLAFLSIGVEKGIIPRSGTEYGNAFNVFDSLRILERDGLLKPLTTLMHAGIKIDKPIFGPDTISPGYYSMNSGTEVPERITNNTNNVLKQFIEEPSVRDLLQDQDRQAFAQILRKMIHKDIPANLVEELYPIRQDLVALNNLIFPSLDSQYKQSEYSQDRKLEELKSLTQNEERRKVLLDPDFQEYLRGLKDKGVDIKPQDFFDYKMDVFDHGEYSRNNPRYEMILIQLFKARDILEVIDPDMTKRILRPLASPYNIYDDLFRLRDFTFYNHTIGLLKQYEIPLDPENFRDAKWIATISQMPFMQPSFLNEIPQDGKAAWINASIKLPQQLQNSLDRSLTRDENYKRIISNEDVERIIKLGDIVSSSEFFPKEFVYDSWQLPEVYQTIGEYKGDLDIIFTNGNPNAEFAKLLIQSKRHNGLSLVLKQEEVVSQYNDFEKSVLATWMVLPDDLKQEVIKEAPDFPNILPDQAEKYRVAAETITRIRNSPSAEIKRLETELIGQLWKLDNPTQVLEEIISVFEKNNLPLVGKVFRVFEILHPPQELDKKLTKNGQVQLSPVLTEAGSRRRYDIIYKDLLKVHIDSYNPSLYSYLTTLRDGQALVDKAHTQGFDSLDADREIPQLTRFLNKMDTLYANSLYGRRLGDAFANPASLAERAENLRRTLNLRDDESLTDRVGRMFIKPLGYENIDQVIQRMKDVRGVAHERNLQFYNEAVGNNNGKLIIEVGDLLKGVKVQYLETFFQNGSVAKEYLGASSDSDYTPLDTDVSRVLPEHLTGNYSDILDQSLAERYGELVFLFRNRGQFQETSPQNAGFNPAMYELFQSGYFGERHWGIRTGIASTEIDAMIATDRLVANDVGKERLFFDIAQAGFYIPVINKDGDILFTPQDYERYRLKTDAITDTLSKPVFSSNDLIQAFKESPYLQRLFEAGVGVSEGYSLEQHTNMVLLQFEKYFSPVWSSQILNRDQFRIVLSLHDLGKPLAVQVTGSTQAQHEYTMKFILPILEQLGFSQREAQIAAVVVDQDYLGDYIKGNKNATQTAQAIKNKSVEVGISTKDMMELLRAYYMSDAGSYTADAGGIASLDRLFNFGLDNQGNRQLQFSPEIQTKYSALLQQVL